MENNRAYSQLLEEREGEQFKNISALWAIIDLWQTLNGGAEIQLRCCLLPKWHISPFYLSANPRVSLCSEWPCSGQGERQQGVHWSKKPILWVTGCSWRLLVNGDSQLNGGCRKRQKTKVVGEGREWTSSRKRKGDEDGVERIWVRKCGGK